MIFFLNPFCLCLCSGTWNWQDTGHQGARWRDEDGGQGLQRRVSQNRVQILHWLGGERGSSVLCLEITETLFFPTWVLEPFFQSRIQCPSSSCIVTSQQERDYEFVSKNILKLWIGVYMFTNVLSFEKNWDWTICQQEIISRLGRWIDFDNDYKSMYPWYMESIWWVFKQLYNKGLVYRGYKVGRFSQWPCHCTPGTWCQCIPGTWYQCTHGTGCQCVSVLQVHGISIPQVYHISALQVHGVSVLQVHCVVQYISVLQVHGVSVLQVHCVSVLLVHQCALGTWCQCTAGTWCQCTAGSSVCSRYMVSVYCRYIVSVYCRYISVLQVDGVSVLQVHGVSVL